MTNFISISDAREQLPTLVKRVNKNLDRTLITVQGQPKAALISLEELESLEETAEILSIPGALDSIKRGERDAKRGRVTPLSQLK